MQHLVFDVVRLVIRSLDIDDPRNNILFYLLWIASDVFWRKGVSFGCEEKEAAAKCPNIGCLRQGFAVFDQLDGSVVQVTGKSSIFQKFFEVVWHSDQVPLYHTFVHMDARWVQIPKDVIIGMHVFDTSGQHSKNREKLLEIEVRFAKGFPRHSVVWRFRL